MRTRPPVVLLINPWIYDFAAYDMWARPLGLLYIASVLRNNGYEICFIDCLSSGADEAGKPLRRRYGDGRFAKVEVEKPPALAAIPRKYSRYGMSTDRFEAELRALPRPDVILVTSMVTYWYPGVFHAIRLAKECHPGVPVVLGGIYATLCHEHALRYSGADFCLRGEGEASVVELVSRLTNRNSSYIPDLNNLDSLPYPG